MHYIVTILVLSSTIDLACMRTSFFPQALDAGGTGCATDMFLYVQVFSNSEVNFVHELIRNCTK